MSAYALLAHAWGAEVAGWDRVETPYLAHLEGIDVTITPEPPQPPAGLGGLRLDRVRGPGRGTPARGPARGARLAALVDRRRRRARQDDDERDDRLLSRPARARSRVPDRRRDPAARRQRARRRRLARRRGRRVGPIGRRAPPRHRGAAERRSRPSRDVQHARRGGRALRDVARTGAARRPCGGARAGAARARRRRRAQPPKRCRRDRGTRARRRASRMPSA